MGNREWRRVYGSVIIAILFGCLGYYAFSYMDCFSGGCAITFLSVFLVLSALGTAGIFFHRARAVDGILSGRGLLVHWTYPDKVSKESAEREYLSYREANRSLFIVMGGMLGIAIVLMILLGGGSRPFHRRGPVHRPGPCLNRLPCCSGPRTETYTWCTKRRLHCKEWGNVRRYGVSFPFLPDETERCLLPGEEQ